MRFAALLMIIGAALFAFAFSMAPYKDEKLFMERYLGMSAGQSKEYWALRDEMLTPRFQLQDYGLTFVAIGLLTALVLRRRAHVSAPNSRAALIVIALAAPFVTVAGYVFDLLLAATRGEFPHWADSMGIPLSGVPFQLLLLLIWAGAHLIFLWGSYQPAAPLALAFSWKANPWLLFVSAVTVIFTALTAALGQYYYALPGVLWLYIYLALAAGRRAANGT
jgi:hypothetical protein